MATLENTQLHVLYVCVRRPVKNTWTCSPSHMDAHGHLSLRPCARCCWRNHVICLWLEIVSRYCIRPQHFSPSKERLMRKYKSLLHRQQGAPANNNNNNKIDKNIKYTETWNVSREWMHTFTASWTKNSWRLYCKVGEKLVTVLYHLITK